MSFFGLPPWPPTGGALPQVGGALQGWFQAMSFMVVTKTIQAFQVKESGEAVNFRGVIQPLKDSALYLKPEGQRTWTWWQMHCDILLPLKNDDVVTYKGKQTRVMSIKDYSAYGYYEYQLAQDWTGAGPEVITP